MRSLLRRGLWAFCKTAVTARARPSLYLDRPIHPVGELNYLSVGIHTSLPLPGLVEESTWGPGENRTSTSGSRWTTANVDQILSYDFDKEDWYISRGRTDQQWPEYPIRPRAGNISLPHLLLQTASTPQLSGEIISQHEDSEVGDQETIYHQFVVLCEPIVEIIFTYCTDCKLSMNCF